VRHASRLAICVALIAVLAPAVAEAAGPTATTAAPGIPGNAQPAPGSPFAPPLQGVDTGPAQTQTTVTATKRAGDTGSGRGTLLLLSLVAILMIFAVGGFIWYESRKMSATKRRRQRLRSGRTPQVAGATSGEGRRGPPPPPRKRRAQAKRKKR